MVADVTVSGALQQAAQTQDQSVTLAEDFNQFLTLLTTQLQNQDPLDPMDSTEFTNQLVQFSQVEQSINTNSKLDDLVSLQLGSISGVALGYVGMDINYISREFNFNGETASKVNYVLPRDAVESNINIFNEAGELVFSDTVPREAGPNEYVWNGQTNGGSIAAPGTYGIQIDAVDKEGSPIENSTVVSGNVRGIESQDGVIFLLVGERAVPLGQVVNASLPQVIEPVTAPEAEEEPV
jgi:flagellar basal-body rod modification protein FlgD